MTDATRRKRLRLFAEAGYFQPRCLCCPENDLRTLELEHVMGRVNGDLVVPMCRNCHDHKSDAAEDHILDLRLPDENRRPLVLQAAFDFGLAGLLTVYAIGRESDGEQMAWLLCAAVLFAWAVWNVAADQHFSSRFGTDYSALVSAQVPR